MFTVMHYVDCTNVVIAVRTAARVGTVVAQLVNYGQEPEHLLLKW